MSVLLEVRVSNHNQIGDKKDSPDFYTKYEKSGMRHVSLTKPCTLYSLLYNQLCNLLDS